MHHPIDETVLAQVVSSKLGIGRYSFQEDCGASDTMTFYKLVHQSSAQKTLLVGVNTLVTKDASEALLQQQKFDQNAAFLRQAAGKNMFIRTGNI